jgi:hypothetical protein
MSEKYQVGYAKPPARTRFSPGKSGNPKGRARGTRNLKTILSRELNSPITVTESGHKRRVSRLDALIKGLVTDALRGDHRSRKLVLDAVMLLEASGALDVGARNKLLSNEELVSRLKARLAGDKAQSK